MVSIEQLDVSIFSDWLIVLGDLISQRLITVEVMFPIKGRNVRDLAVQCTRQLQGVQETLVVQFGLCAGQ